MLKESDLIPYRCSEPPPGPWLLFAPHADDETIGFGGALALARRAGTAVTVVVLTDGALGGDEGGLVEAREAEAREATAILGVEDCRFWRLPDRGVSADEGGVARVAGLIEELAPATVLFPSPMEPHVDHRATAALVWEALRRARGEGARPAAYEISVQGPINRVVDITGVREIKRRALAAYRSQLAQNNYAAVAEAINRSRTFSLPGEVAAAEGFYLFECDDLRLGYAEMVRWLLSPYWLDVPRAPVSEVVSGRNPNSPRGLFGEWLRRLRGG